jgi:hypothetical protein
MDGREILILLESAPEVIEPSALGIKSGVEAATFRNPPGKHKIAGGNNPGDKDKEP